MTQRIALVTGGSRGLGKNAALKLAAKGTDILLTYHSNRQAALEVVAEIEQKGVKAAALAWCLICKNLLALNPFWADLVCRMTTFTRRTSICTCLPGTVALTP